MSTILLARMGLGHVTYRRTYRPWRLTLQCGCVKPATGVYESMSCNAHVGLHAVVQAEPVRQS